MKNYRDILIEKYFSTTHLYTLPTTSEGWMWVIKRIEDNFGKVFSSLSLDAKILDIACGVGYLEYYLLKKGFYNIEAVDLSAEQIDVAKKNLEKFGLNLKSVTFKIYNALSYLKEKKDEYHLIAMIDFVDHLFKEEIISVLIDSYNALKENGFLIIRTTNMDNLFSSSHFYNDFTHETGFTKNSLAQCLRVAGFKEIKVDYEIVKPYPTNKKSIIRIIKQLFRPIRPYLIGKFLGVNPQSLAENLVAIAKK